MLNDKSNIQTIYTDSICKENESLIYKGLIDNLIYVNLIHHLSFTHIVEIIINNERFQEYNPVKISKQIKNVILYIIKTDPDFFDDFESIFRDAVTEKDKISLTKLHLVINLFKSLYEKVTKYKYINISFNLDVINVCKNIITFTIYLLIFDERIILENQSEFQYNIIKLFTNLY
jgi:hypothetical protein